MSLPKVLLCGGLLVGTLAAPPAEARFGKRSDSNETSKPVHPATAIGADDDDDDDDAKPDEDENRPQRAPVTVSSSEDSFRSSASDDAAAIILGAVFELLLSGLGEVIITTGTHHGAQPSDDPNEVPLPGSLKHAVPFSFRLGMQMASYSRGTGLDFALGWDLHRFGADLRLARLEVARGATDFRDPNFLGAFHLTYAPIVQDALRVRGELGVSTATLARGFYVGPSLGMSLEACVLGPLDVEARMQVTPFPYRQADLRAGLALHLGSLMLRGGVHGLFLDPDVSPTARDRLFGPEFGLGFTF